MTSTSNMQETVKVRLFLISDTHGRVPTSDSPIFRTPLPKCDILIHAGDMTTTGKLEEYERTLAWIKDVDAELKIIIAGNHDITLDPAHYASSGPAYHTTPESPTLCHSLFTSPSSKASNIHYLPEGTYTFTLPHANTTFTLHASPYQPEFRKWAFSYPRTLDRWNPLPSTPLLTAAGIPPVPENTDILLTHGPAQGLRDLAGLAPQTHEGCPWLLGALRRVRPRLHVCGHIHESFGATRVEWGDGGVEKGRRELEPLGWLEGEELAKRTGACAAWEVDVSAAAECPLGGKGVETLVVNASLLSRTLKVVHAGVLVDMELPKAEAV